MGLDSFNVAEDNKGGRPEGSTEKRNFAPQVAEYGEPMTIDHGEEYLQKLMDKFVEGDKPTDEEMGKMCDYAHLLPRSMRSELKKHDVVDYPDVQIGVVSKEHSQDQGSLTEEKEEKGGLFAVINEST